MEQIKVKNIAQHGGAFGPPTWEHGVVYCSVCHLTSPNNVFCKSCGKATCVQGEGNPVGCMDAMGPEVVDFQCIECQRKELIGTIDYHMGDTNEAGEVDPESLSPDPLAIIGLLDINEDGIWDLTTSYLRRSYTPAPQNIYHLSIPLHSSKRDNPRTTKKLLNWMTCDVNILTIVEANSDSQSGEIEYMDSKNQPCTNSLDDIYHHFIGPVFEKRVAAMQKGSRGLILVGSGEASRNSEHYVKAIQLVQSNVLTFLLSFSSRIVNGPDMQPRLLQFMRAVFLERKGPWEAVLDLMATSEVLSHTPIVLTFREGETIRSRRVVYSWPHFSPWGLDKLKVCQSPNKCLSRPGELTMDWEGVELWLETGRGEPRKIADPHGKIRFECSRCKYKSPWVFRPDWLGRYPYRPLVYWHDWPLDAQKQTALLEQFRSRDGPPAVPLWVQQSRAIAAQKRTEREARRAAHDQPGPAPRGGSRERSARRPHNRPELPPRRASPAPERNAPRAYDRPELPPPARGRSRERSPRRPYGRPERPQRGGSRRRSRSPRPHHNRPELVPRERSPRRSYHRPEPPQRGWSRERRRPYDRLDVPQGRWSRERNYRRPYERPRSRERPPRPYDRPDLPQQGRSWAERLRDP